MRKINYLSMQYLRKNKFQISKVNVFVMKINASKILKNSHKKTGICHVEIQQLFSCLHSHVNRNVNEKQNLFLLVQSSKEIFFSQCSSSSSLLSKANFSSKFGNNFVSNCSFQTIENVKNFFLFLSRW